MEEGKKDWKEKISALKGKKGLDTLLVVVVIAAIAFIYITSYGGSSNQNEKTVDTVAPAATQSVDDGDLEPKLESALSSIRGAGTVKVLVTYESGSELVPAMNTQTQTDDEQKGDSGSATSSENTKSELATIQKNGDSAAVVLREDAPKVRGVVVIAQGAGDVSVRMQLAQAVCTVLSIEQSKVEVFEMQ